MSGDALAEPAKLNGPFWTRAEWLISGAATASIQPGNELRTVGWGEPLIVADMAPLTVAVTGEDVSLISPMVPRNDIAGATFVIPARARLHPMTARLGRRSVFPIGGRLFCTPEDPQYPGLFVGYEQRACLIDADNDGDFDEAATASGSTVHTSVSDFVVSQATPLPRSVPYTYSEDRPIVAKIVLVPVRRSAGAAIEWGAWIDGKKPEAKPFSIDKVISLGASIDKSKPGYTLEKLDGAALPTQVNVAGAVLEITKFDANGMTFRFIAGFDEKQPLRYWSNTKFPSLPPEAHGGSAK